MTFTFTETDGEGQVFLLEFDTDREPDYNKIADMIIEIVGERPEREERRS